MKIGNILKEELKEGLTVRVVPYSRRAENRVALHGRDMRLLQVRADRFLVESIGKTDRGETWKGWFATFEAAWVNLYHEL